MPKLPKWIDEAADDVHNAVLGELKYGGRVTPVHDMAFIISKHIPKKRKRKTSGSQTLRGVRKT